MKTESRKGRDEENREIVEMMKSTAGVRKETLSAGFLTVGSFSYILPSVYHIKYSSSGFKERNL